MSAQIRVMNAAGEYEPYEEEKVRSSLARAEADGVFQDRIVEHLRTKLYDGIPTKVVYKEILHLLKKLKSSLASRYHLKQAIMELGPTGFPFEKYFAGVLESYGYKTVTNDYIRGKCVTHEIDIVAWKEDCHVAAAPRKDIAALGMTSSKIMIECKFHHEPGVRSDIKDGLYTYARFLDIKENGFDEIWLVTNTKATSELVAYGNCAGLKVISWNYPEDFSLRLLVSQKKLHPITVLNSLSSVDKQILLANNIIFCYELLNPKVNCLPKDALIKAQNEARLVIGTN